MSATRTALFFQRVFILAATGAFGMLVLGVITGALAVGGSLTDRALMALGAMFIMGDWTGPDDMFTILWACGWIIGALALVAAIALAGWGLAEICRRGSRQPLRR